MRLYFSVIFFFFITVSSLLAQTVKLTQLETGKVGLTKTEGLVGVTNTQGKQRYMSYVKVAQIPIGFTPTATGNLTNLNEFVTQNPSDTVWYIDYKGNSIVIGVRDGGGAGAAANDRDWLRVTINTIPDSIGQYIYTYNGASVGARLQRENVEFIVNDSTATGVASQFIQGPRESSLTFWRNLDQLYTENIQKGNEYQITSKDGVVGMRIGTTAAGNPPNVTQTDTHLALDYVNMNVVVPHYPNTRNDPGSPVNVLTTSSTGVVESHLVSEVLADATTVTNTATIANTGTLPNLSFGVVANSLDSTFIKPNSLAWSDLSAATQDSIRQDIYVDTVLNYAALRAYSGKSKLLFVQDRSYTFNATNYSTLGGLFRRVTSGTENGGTIISGTFKWARIWDNVRVHPEWWEVGGYDQRGNAYVSKNILGTGSDGVTAIYSDGIYNERDRIQAAIDVVSSGGTIVLKPDYTYSIDIKLVLKDKQSIQGNGATLKRANTFQSTANYAVGGITATSASGLRVGMSFIIRNSANNTDNTGEMIVTGISGNVISHYSGNPNAGNTLLSVSDIFNKTSPNLDHYFFVERLNIDGNRANNPVSNFYFNVAFAWEGNGATIEDVNIKESPSESIVLGFGKINNISAKNLNGSFVHFSNNCYTSNLKNIAITSCIVDSVCLSSMTVNGHNEGAFTASNNSRNIYIDNIRLSNCGNALFGDFTTGGYNPCEIGLFLEQDKAELKVTNSIFKNTNGLGLFAGDNNTTLREAFSNFTFQDNVFENCGFLNIVNGLSASYQIGTENRSLHINNNTFTNCTISISGMSFWEISDNIFYIDKDRSNPIDPTFYLGSSRSGLNRAMIAITNCTRFAINNNYIEGDYSAENTNLRYGISILLDPSGSSYILKVGASNTDYFYPQHIQISGNKISGFYRGINAGTDGYMFWQGLKQTVGWRINDNTIFQHPTWNDVGTFGAAIVAPPGALVEDNTIYAAPSSVTWVRYIQVVGIQPDGTGNQNRLFGAIVQNNRIFGVPSGVFAIAVGDAGVSEYNNVIKDNLITGAGTIQLWGIAASNTHLSNNITLNSSLLPAFTAPQRPVAGHWRENKANY